MNTATQTHGDVLELVEQPQECHQAPAVIASKALQAAQSPAVTPTDLLRIAMESGDKDIDRLERLMSMDLRYRELQEVDRQRASVLSFRRDFAAFRGENIIIPKAKHVDRGRAGSFNQAEYDQVCIRLSPALSKHGFGFRHDQKFGSRKWAGADGTESDIPWVWVTCFLEHKDGHAETLLLEGPQGDQSANTPAQNMQLTASYFKRQSLLAITGTATGGEDDESLMRKRKQSGDSADDPPWDDAPPEKVFYAEAGFAKNFPAWEKLIQAGTKDANQIIATVETKAPMTDEQKAKLRAVKPSTAK